jgi:N-acetylneuraminic acid mutarotase
LKKLCLLLTVTLAFLTISCIFAIQAKSDVTPKENSWATMAMMPNGREAFGAIGVNGKLYAISGASNGYITFNDMYDPETNSWATRQPIPAAKTAFGIAAYKEKIYCIGGSGYNQVFDSNYVYDSVADLWTTKTPMPTPRTYLAANTVNDKIYLIGGSTSLSKSSIVTSNEVYDIATDVWSTKSSLPVAVTSYSSVALNGKIYIIGGLSPFESNLVPLESNLVQIYDCATDAWSLGASLPVALSGTIAVATSGFHAPEKIYVFGGHYSGNETVWANRNFNYNWIYDPENDFWSNGTVMPTKRAYLGVANVDDLLYVIGGSVSDHDPFSRVNERYTPFGYSEVPLKTSPPPEGDGQSELPTIAIVAGVAVAATVIVVTGVLVYHFKHAPAKSV